jgi:hypothetical protein
MTQTSPQCLQPHVADREADYRANLLILSKQLARKRRIELTAMTKDVNRIITLSRVPNVGIPVCAACCDVAFY